MNLQGVLHAAAVAIARRPFITLLLLTAALAPLLMASARVRPDNSLASWFVAGDPALASYEGFLRDYGNDEAILVGFEVPEGAHSEAGIALQRRIAERLAAIDGIAHVLAGGTLPPQLARGLVAADARAVGVVAWMEVRPDMERARGRIIRESREAARAELEPVGRVAHLAGNGVLYEGLNQQTMRDTGVFLSLALLVMVVLLWLGLGSGRAVVLALVAPLLASGAAIGMLGISGRPFTVVGSALPTLVLVIALADAIHVLLHYHQVRRFAPPANDAERRTQVASAVSWVAVPCLLTSLTTAAGFLALGTSRIALVRDFGLLAAAGMLLAWVITLVFLAAALARWDVAPAARIPILRPVERLLDAVAASLPRMRRPVLLAAGVATVALGAGALRLEADTDTIGLLPAEHQVRRDSDWLEQHLGAYTPLEMRVSHDPATAGADSMASAGRFAVQLRDWRTRVEALPGVTRTFTAGDLGVAAPEAVRDSYQSADGRSTRVTAYVPMTSSDGMARAAADMERAGRDIFGRDDAVDATGYLPLYVRISDYVVQSTVSGLAVALVIVFAMLALLIRSRRGVVAAIPVNLLPVLVVFGVMGWAGIPLDIATATVGAIVLGIVVDDTIHFLHRFTTEQRAGRSRAEAAAESVRRAGRGLVLTSLVLGAGFAVMTAAGTKAIAYFGLVAALAVAGALLADLTLLPVLLAGRTQPSESVRIGGTSSVLTARPRGDAPRLPGDLRIESGEGSPPALFHDPGWPVSDREPPGTDATWAVAIAAGYPVARLATYVRHDMTSAPGASGIIGHFDAIDDVAGAHLLGDAVHRLHAEGVRRVIGPMNGSTWRRYRVALPPAAQDTSATPFLGEPENPPGYPAIFAAAGFRVAASYESRITRDLGTGNPRARAAGTTIAARGITIAPIDTSRFDDELADLHALSVRAFPENRYYTPIDVGEFRAMYTPMRGMIDPELVLLARSAERQLVAYVFAYADPLSVRDGRPTRLIVKTLATDPDWRSIGLGAVLVERLHEAARRRHLEAIIHALMYADNNSVKISAHTAQVCRRYVLYEHDGGDRG